MKKYFWIFLLPIWILTACAPQPTQQLLIPNDGPAPTKVLTQRTPAQTAVLAALAATLNLPREQIAITSTDAVDWPDGCLGVQKVGVLCTQAIVPGYKIVLQANGLLYEFHTNKDGKQIVAVGEVALVGTVQKMLIKQLASNLGLKEKDIKVVSTVKIEFADGCLGVAMENVTCGQVVTPGQIVVLESEGIQYEYHISNDGKRIQPATLALTWKREGGIAGFCDSLTVFLSGEVYGNQCKSQPNGTVGTFATVLSATEREQFDTWFKELGQISLDASNPVGVSDRMVVKLELYGSGKGTVQKADEQELFHWAQNLYQKLSQ